VGATTIRQATRYANYQAVEGTAMPRQIERFQGTQRRFQIKIATSLLQASATDGPSILDGSPKS
jgi:hypothetical protein